jgi:O-methyltransferase
MNNYFITKVPYTKSNVAASSIRLLRFINKGFRALKLKYVVSPIDTTVDMNTVEQRINYYHLLNQVLLCEVEGDVIELGCFTGQCALLFQKVLEQNDSAKELHLYDSFEIKFSEQGDIKDVLMASFKSADLKPPILHKGLFKDTVPSELPEKLCFVHIDCGHGGNVEDHKNILLEVLNSIYPRMAPGGVCVLMDYNDPKINGIGHDANPGVKLACDRFLQDKEEEIIPLYGNQYYHAYFRKKAT